MLSVLQQVLNFIELPFLLLWIVFAKKTFRGKLIWGLAHFTPHIKTHKNNLNRWQKALVCFVKHHCFNTFAAGV